MPRLKPETQAARRAHILDAAERCFARTGFHATTMNDICREAVVSAGALYIYFASKEELIAGLCERERAKLKADLATTPLPAKIYAGEGCAQVLFFESDADDVCEVSYKDRGGKYQGQVGVTLPKA